MNETTTVRYNRVSYWSMPAKTTYIVPQQDGWAVKKESSDEFAVNNGDQSAPKKAPTERVYSTQRKAVEAARRMTRRSSASQIVVFGRDGSIRRREVHGLPTVQRSRLKSDLGRKAIEKAVSAVIRERL